MVQGSAGQCVLLASVGALTFLLLPVTLPSACTATGILMRHCRQRFGRCSAKPLAAGARASSTFSPTGLQGPAWAHLGVTEAEDGIPQP